MHNRVGEADNHVDRRANAAVEDSTMTIEYLRARLHAERSVSKAARERVDELAERVSELEEQLKIVILQRKKAEKATLDVLSVLESHGIQEISDDCDSDSGLDESFCEPNLDKSYLIREDGSSVNSKLKEVSSGSEQETTTTPSTGRSLSWNSRKDSLRSRERKYSGPSHRRRTDFAHFGTLPKHLYGKSCRQVKRSEIRSMVERSRLKSTSLEAEGDGAADSLEHIVNSLDSRMEESRRSSEIKDENASLQEKTSGTLETEKHASNASVSLNKGGYDEKMDRALQHQAQLIDCYEAEERAQREWEEKYRDHGNGTLDSCEPSNHSDVTEDRDETKAVVPHSAEIITQHSHDHKSAEAPTCFPKDTSIAHFDSFKFSPKAVAEHPEDEKSNEFQASRSSAPPDFAFPVVNDTQTQCPGEKCSTHSTSHGSQYHASNDLASNHVVSSLHTRICSCEAETSKSRNDQYELTPYKGDHQLSGVLNALQEAKLYLGQQMNSLPSVGVRSVSKTVEPLGSATRDLKISVGSAGLFRVPTDFHFEAPQRSLCSHNSSHSTEYHAYPSLPLAASNHHLVHSMERNAFSSSGRFFDSPSTANESRYLSGRQSYGKSFPSSSEGAFLPHSPYADMMPRLSSGEMVSAPSPSRAFGVTPTRDPLLYDDHVSPSMYR